MPLNNDIYLAPIIPVEILKITGNGKPYFVKVWKLNLQRNILKMLQAKNYKELIKNLYHIKCIEMQLSKIQL